MASMNGEKINNAKMFDKYTVDLMKGKTENDSFFYRDSMLEFLEEMDRQEFIERFKWYNTPKGINGDLIERIMYYRANGTLFYMQENEKFYFLPYALSGNVDVYGKYLEITPLPFAGPTATTDKDGNYKPWIPGLTKIPVYDFPEYEELTEEFINKSCILLNDRSQGMSQLVKPRFKLSEPIIRISAEMFPLLRTNLIASSGVKSLRVPDESMKENALLAFNNIYKHSMEGNPFMATTGALDFQDLTSNGLGAKPESFLMAMQSLENFRLSGMGLKSGGLFQKKAHELQSESDINDGVSSLVLNNELAKRQHFCDMYNYIFAEPLGLPFMWVEINESVLGIDLNGDGASIAEEDQNGIPGEQPLSSEMNGDE